ncbi:DUF6520 family protein [Aequorivita sp. F47161]|uniref:DUF6520 family protein n=1 Tax=Aequorivita vitellina TaxID=2874475 RepID=A0A9X1U3N6_9FLAO|nr:DUF6520 family protein [Aequorivita vitellina]MCG2419748.1 DUF6520 family protein [Aequorivita vitellina]
MKKSSKNWLLPLVAIALAIGGAFATNLNTNDNMLSTGYATVHMPCDTPVDCSTVPGLACKAPSGQIAYGKINPNDGFCPVILYRK